MIITGILLVSIIFMLMLLLDILEETRNIKFIIEEKFRKNEDEAK